jgi:hypothetical protein
MQGDKGIKKIHQLIVSGKDACVLFPQPLTHLPSSWWPGQTLPITLEQAALNCVACAKLCLIETHKEKQLFWF